MIRDALLAVGFVLVAATDFELRVDSIPDRICVKSREVCETARDAIRSGRWSLGISPNVATSCMPAPGCFSDQSEQILNLNDPATLARRR